MRLISAKFVIYYPCETILSSYKTPTRNKANKTQQQSLFPGDLCYV